MPHYYFDLKNGTTQRDHAGLDLANDAAAIARGELIAAQRGIAGGERDHACHVSIIREDGHEVMRVEVAPAERPSAPRLKKRS